MQTNGNAQVNSAKSGVNSKVEKLTFFGRTKREQWRNKRRYITI